MSSGLQDNPTQQLICVDSKGRPNGKTTDRKSGHTAPGIKHLAIQILVFNSKNELILHERPARKVGGNVLDAPTTHILNGETQMESAYRCLKNEYGITKKIPITLLNGYSYERDYGDGSCENEFCLAAFAVYEGKITPNKEEVQKVVCISAKLVLEELNASPETFPPWFKESVDVVVASEEGRLFFS